MTELGQFPPVVVYTYVSLKPIDYTISKNVITML